MITNSVANLYRQQTTNGVTAYAGTPYAVWSSYLEPLTDVAHLKDDLAISSHKAIGPNTTPPLAIGDLAVVYIGSQQGRYRVVGVLPYSTMMGGHHQEVYLVKAL